MRLRALFAVLLSVPLVLAPVAVAAETPTPSPTPGPTPAGDPGTFIAYDAQFHAVNVSRDGETADQGFYPVSIRIDCDDSGCTLSGLPIGQVDAVEIEGGSGTWSFPAQGTVCGDDPYYGPTVLTIEATATTISGVLTRESSPDEFCPSQTYQWGTTWTIEGTAIAGDACVLEEETCPPEPTPTPTAEPVAVAFSEHREASAPSILSGLATPAETLAPSQIGLAAALTVILVILIAFPTHLLNIAVDSGSERWNAWRRKRRGVTTESVPDRGGRYPGLLPASLGVLAAGVIASFVDPAFGFDLASIRVLATVVLSFAVEVALGWFVVIWIARRWQPELSPTFRFAPLTLLIVVATVLFTRVTAFEPGIVFGLVAGVAFGAALAQAERARIALIGLGYGFVIAIIGWVGYALVDPTAVALREFLSALAIAGIAALPIGLIPLRGLAGHEVWTWNRWIWSGAYAVGLLGFFLVLMPMPFAWDGVRASLWAWVGLYLGYAAVAVALWLVTVRPWVRTGNRDTNEA
ncbi:MAG: hypothetical protein U1E32_12570 [Rhodoglobus sp.]|nr:hypothetical protein [Rhodoglobus sp.]